MDWFDDGFLDWDDWYIIGPLSEELQEERRRRFLEENSEDDDDEYEPY